MFLAHVFFFSKIVKSQSSLMLHGERTRPLFACKTDRSGRDTLDSAIINTHRANKTVTRSDVLNN